MASVRKVKSTYKGVVSERWVCEYTDQGGKRRSKTAKSKKDADKLRLKIEVEIEGGVHTAERAAPSFTEACDIFLRDCERRHREGDMMTGHSLARHVSRIRTHLRPRFGAKRIGTISSDDARAMVDDLRDSLTVGTVNQIVSELSLILDMAVRRKWIKRNCLRDDPVRLRGGKRKKPRIPTRDEMGALLRAAWELDPRERYVSYLNRIAVVSLGLFGGLRVGEMSGLRWSDIDFAEGTIHVRHSWSVHDGLKETKTAAGERSVPLSAPIREALIEVLRFWQTRQQITPEYQAGDDRRSHRILRRALAKGHDADLRELPTGHVLLSTRNTPIGHYAKELWAPLMKKAGLVDEAGRVLFSMHKMRHAAVSLFIEAGLPAMNLKAVIGHSNISTTYNVYGHLFPDDRRAYAVADSIAAQFNTTKNVQIPLTH